MGVFSDLKKIGKGALKFGERSLGLKTFKRAYEEPSIKRIFGAGLEAVTTPGAPLKGLFRTPIGKGEDGIPRPTKDSSPEEINKFIDAYSGFTEDEMKSVFSLMETHNRFSNMIQGGDPIPGETFSLYNDDGWAKLATGNIPDSLILHPYMPVDRKLMETLQGDNRLMGAFLRVTDSASMLPAIPTEFGHRKNRSTLGGKFLDGVWDVAGRPIGGLMEALAWPADQIELLVGQNIVWNDVKDPYVRRQLAKSAYEFGVTGTTGLFPQNWENPRVDAVRMKANELYNEGYRGDAAMEALAGTMKDNMSTRATIFGFMGSAVIDPLNLAFGAGFLAKSGMKVTKVAAAAAGIEKGRRATQAGEAISLFPKLPRVMGPGRVLLGQHTYRELLAAEELTYQGWRLRTPARGPLLRLFEQTPHGFAAEAARQFNTVFARNESLTPDAVRLFDEVIKTGKISPEVERVFGTRFSTNPQLARFMTMAREGKWSLMDEIFGKGRKQLVALEELGKIADESPSAAGWISREAIMTHLQSFAMKEQEKYLPHMVTRRLRPFVTAEKAAMGVFTLSRPAFITLNMANNLFTYMWLAGDPGKVFQYGKTWTQAMFTEFSTGMPWAGYPDAFKRILGAADVSPNVAESIIASGTSGGDIMALKAKQFFHGTLDEGAEELVSWAKQFEKNPAKMSSDFTWRSVLTWPVDAATHVDRATRRATYMMSLKEQYHWGLRPQVLAPKMIESLTADGFSPENSERIANKLIGRLRSEAQTGRPVLRPEEMEAIYRETLAEMDDLVPPLSTLDYLLKYAAERGHTGEAAWGFIQPLQHIEGRINEEVLDAIGKLSKNKRDLTIDLINDGTYDFDYLQSVLTHTQPVIRQGFTYSNHLKVTEESLRQAMADDIGHLERLFNQVFQGSWNGRKRRLFYEKVGSLMSDHMDELANINKEHAAALLADEAPGTRTAPLWDAFWENKKSRMSEVYTSARGAIGELHEGPLEALDNWYAANGRTTARARELLAEALGDGSKETWARTGDAMKGLYAGHARKNAEIFGWPVNEPALNMGHERPSALLATRADDFLEWLKVKITDDLATVAPEFTDEMTALRGELSDIQKDIRKAQREAKKPPGEAPAVAIDMTALDARRTEIRARLRELGDTSPLKAQIDTRRAMLASVEKSIPNMAALGTHVRQLILANANSKTDFVMLNYNQQYGMDTVMQAFFPYMFFPSRTAINWGIRIAKSPGAGALLSKALLAPQEYAELYGYPERTENAIPIPIPFLGNMLQEVPLINKWLQTGEFSHLYWVDPMQLMFPMTSYTRDFDDEKRKGTPAGMLLDWAENNTPFGLNPVAKIIGSETGFLDKEAWEQSLFSGGPFGIPITPTARAAAGWLQAGSPEGMPEEEMENYENGGFFSSGFLARIFNLSNPRFDEYRAERSLWALVATDSLIPGKSHDEQTELAWKAMLDHSGPAWRNAVKHAQSEQFLREFTGATFARVTPVLEGELKMKTAQKMAFNEAQRRGDLDTFYEKFPEYEGYQAAVKGLSDPTERLAAVETKFFYDMVDEFAEQPYQLQLDRLDDALRVLAEQVQTESVRDQTKVLKLQRAQTNMQKAATRSLIEKAFPNRETNPSLNRDPYDRAMRVMEDEWYSLLEDETPLSEDEKTLVRRALLNDNPTTKDIREVQKLIQRESDRNDKPYEELELAREKWLKQLPAASTKSDPGVWMKLSVESMVTKLRYGYAIDEAMKTEDFSTYRRLIAERDGALEAVHDSALSHLTRWDVEAYLNRRNRPKTPEETSFEDANSLFDLWMSMVDDRTPLSSREKAAVSEYFRNRPEIKLHYHSWSLDIDNLSSEQIYALSRRREIWQRYRDTEDEGAKLDYMHSVRTELNSLNALLGMPPITLLDYERMPPSIGVGLGDEEFKRDVFADRQIRDLLAKARLTSEDQELLERLLQEQDPGKLTEAEIDRYIRLALQRGY